MTANSSDPLLDLGLDPKLPSLEQALTHPSFANEQRGGRVKDNQRLEFLGDAVLGLCASVLLTERFPEADEGQLSLMRSTLVSTEALADWAREARVGEALRLGRGADAAGERSQKNVLADAVEAIVAAVYTDLGMDSARALCERIVAVRLARLVSGETVLARDAKSELQEKIQSGGGASPRYRVLASEGPDHERLFVVAVEANDATIGEGRGRSKKLAEQAAARDALARLAVVGAPDSNARKENGEP
jgi:ribonuclease-3